MINIDVVSRKFYGRTFIGGHLEDFQLEKNKGFDRYTSTLFVKSLLNIAKVMEGDVWQWMQENRC